MQQKDRRSTERISNIVGLALTVVCHVCAFAFISFSGIKYLYPPPPENTFLMELEEDEAVPEPIRGRSRQPRSETVDKEKEVNLVQKSESPHQSKAQNLTPATKENGYGDVEVPSPEREEEPKLDPRASFPGMSRKDTSVTAPHSAEKPSDYFKRGQPDGNTNTGKVEGKANAHLEGRSVQGTLGKPAYTVQESGVVVVKIWVDQYGNVTKAQAGAMGTTVTDSKLWTAARNEAMKAKFNTKPDAPVLQEGTITYRFNLK